MGFDFVIHSELTAMEFRLSLILTLFGLLAAVESKTVNEEFTISQGSLRVRRSSEISDPLDQVVSGDDHIDEDQNVREEPQENIYPKEEKEEDSFEEEHGEEQREDENDGEEPEVLSRKDENSNDPPTSKQEVN